MQVLSPLLSPPYPAEQYRGAGLDCGSVLAACALDPGVARSSQSDTSSTLEEENKSTSACDGAVCTHPRESSLYDLRVELGLMAPSRSIV